MCRPSSRYPLFTFTRRLHPARPRAGFLKSTKNALHSQRALRITEMRKTPSHPEQRPKSSPVARAWKRHPKQRLGQCSGTRIVRRTKLICSTSRLRAVTSVRGVLTDHICCKCWQCCSCGHGANRGVAIAAGCHAQLLGTNAIVIRGQVRSNTRPTR